MQHLNKLSLLPQQNFYMAMGTFLNRMGSTALLFLLLYLHKSRALSLSFSGMILSCYGIGALFAGPIGGWISDKYGAPEVCIFSLFTSGLLLLLYPLVHTEWLLFVTLLWGLIGEAYRPASQVIISHLCPPEHRKIAYALNRLALNLGMSIAPLLGGFLIVWHYDGIFYIDGITSIIAAIFLYQVLWRHFKNNPIIRDSRKLFFTSLLVVLKDKRMLHLIFAMILSLIILFQQSSTLSLFMVDHLHLATALFGFMCMLNTLMVVFIELPLNIKIANAKFHIVLVFAALLIGCGFGIYFFANELLLIAGGVVIWTLGEMMLFPAIASYIFEIAPPEYRGAYMGFYSMGVNVAFIAGPLIGTFFYHATNSNTIWLVCFFIGIVSAFLFYLQNRYEKVI